MQIPQEQEQVQDQGPTLQDRMVKADQAQKDGVPVNWQAVCYENYNILTAEVQRLSEENMALKKQLVQEDEKGTET